MKAHIIKSIEAYENKQLGQENVGTTDHCIRVCQAIVATTLGFRSRNDWSELVYDAPDCPNHKVLRVMDKFRVSRKCKGDMPFPEVIRMCKKIITRYLEQPTYANGDLQRSWDRVSQEEHDQLVAICQMNGWLKRNGYDFEDGFLDVQSGDYEYAFRRIHAPSLLGHFFRHGSWAIRTGILYHDLAFINQVNGGDEYWTLKKFGNKWLPFESVSFLLIIEKGEFYEYLHRLDVATLEQCKTYTY